MGRKKIKKKWIICILWSIIAAILLLLVFIAAPYENSRLQEIIGKIVLCYVSASCVVTGIVAHMAKEEKKQKENLS